MEKMIQPISSAESIMAAQAANAPAPPTPVNPTATSQPIPAPEATSSPAAAQLQPVVAPVPTIAPAPDIYPQATRGSSVSDEYSAHFGVAASSNPALTSTPKPRLPVGVYIIAGLSLLSLLLGFIFDGESSAIYWIATVLQLLLAIGLLLRNNLARIVFMVIAVLGIVGAGITVLNIMNIKDRGDQLYHAAQVAYADEKVQLHGNVPAEQKQQMQQLDTAEQRITKLYTQAYIREGVECSLLIAELTYLALPGVKQAFA